MSTPSTNSRPQALRQILLKQTRVAIREVILDAADQVALEDGFKSAKMLRIAKLAGVSVGTLYTHFSSKDSMFLALSERQRSRYFAELTRPSASTDPIERLEEYVARTLDYIERNSVPFAAHLQASMCQSDDPVAAILGTNPGDDQKRYDALLTNLLADCIKGKRLRDDIAIEELAWALRNLLSATIVAWLRTLNQQPLTASGKRLLGLFLQGAASRSSMKPLETGESVQAAEQE